MNTAVSKSADNALISVVMPCFNAEQYLRDSIDCVLKQTYPRVELIVVDDGSTDNSREILKEYADRIRIIEQSRQGPGPARNKGIALCQGEFVAFLDADDLWELSALEKLHDRLRTHEGAALAYCGWQNIDRPRRGGEPYVPPDYEGPEKIEFFLKGASPWAIHAALVRRSALEEIGGFDPRWPTCEDYDLWLRLATDRPIVRVPEVLAYYRHHGEGQITHRQWRQAKYAWLVKKAFIARHPEAVKGLAKERVRDLIDGALLRRGFENYWKRDLVAAQRIFRLALRTRYWRTRDLQYLLPALLPEPFYVKLISAVDRQGREANGVHR